MSTSRISGTQAGNQESDLSKQIESNVEKAFNAAVDPLSYGGKTVSSVSLALEEVTPVLKNSWSSIIAVTLDSIVPSDENCQIRYTINLAAPYVDTFTIEFMQCGGTDEAEDRMKAFLRSLNLDFNRVNPPQNKERIGICGLTGRRVVFFYRDSIFAIIRHPFQAPDEGYRIEKLAKALDDYFLSGSVQPALQKVPLARLLSDSTIRTKVGSNFSFSIATGRDTFPVRTSMVANPEIAYQVENGTEDGKYTFYASCAGETAIDLIVIQSKYFTIQKIKVKAVVT